MDCIGAIDGTHIQVVIGEDKKVPYLRRKGVPTQNVMVACDFDLPFTFVMAGWEGVAHDTRNFRRCYPYNLLLLLQFVNI